jgi:hypothetical protein
MVDDVEEMISLKFMGEKACKIVSTSTFKSVFGRFNKECEIGGANISYLWIDV